MRLLTAVLVAVFAAPGCHTPTTVAAVEDVKGFASQVGRYVPEIHLLRPDGKKIKLRTAIGPFYVLGFVSPPGDTPNYMHPALIEMAKKLGGIEQVPVVQVTEPTDKCSFGPDAMEGLPKPPYNLLILLDCNRRAWEALGRPKDGTLILIDTNQIIKAFGTVDDPRPIIMSAYEEARKWERIEWREMMDRMNGS